MVKAVGESEYSVVQIPISKLYLDVANVRSSPGDIGHLEDSITEQGILEPIIVRKGKDGRYGIVIGGRRFQAAKSIGLTTLPAIIKDIDDETAILDSFAENMQRANLSEKDQSKVISRFYTVLKSQRKVAQKLNISKTQVHRHLLCCGLIKAKDETAGPHVDQGAESTPIDNSVPAGEYDDESTSGDYENEDTEKISQIASTGARLFPDDPKKQVELADQLKDKPRAEVTNILKELRREVKNGGDIDDITDAIGKTHAKIPQRLSLNIPSTLYQELLCYSERHHKPIPEIVLSAIERFLKNDSGGC